MKQILLFSLVLLCGGSHWLVGQVSPYVISFFVKPLPIAPTAALEKALKGKDAEKSSLSSVNKVFNVSFLHMGMYAMYTGSVTHSGPDGQILFERRSPDPKLTVLITSAIKPIPINPLSQKTLYGFLVKEGDHAQQYLFERLQDPETENYLWQVTSVPLDRNQRISYDTIILYADPRNVIVPLGSTATKLSENFLLPDFYVTQQYNSALNALNFLKIRHYFAPETFDFTFLPNGYQKKIGIERLSS